MEIPTYQRDTSVPASVYQPLSTPSAEQLTGGALSMAKDAIRNSSVLADLKRAEKEEGERIASLEALTLVAERSREIQQMLSDVERTSSTQVEYSRRVTDEIKRINDKYDGFSKRLLFPIATATYRENAAKEDLRFESQIITGRGKVAEKNLKAIVDRTKDQAINAATAAAKRQAYGVSRADDIGADISLPMRAIYNAAKDFWDRDTAERAMVDQAKDVLKALALHWMSEKPEDPSILEDLKKVKVLLEDKTYVDIGLNDAEVAAIKQDFAKEALRRESEDNTKLDRLESKEIDVINKYVNEAKLALLKGETLPPEPEGISTMRAMAALAKGRLEIEASRKDMEGARAEGKVGDNEYYYFMLARSIIDGGSPAWVNAVGEALKKGKINRAEAASLAKERSEIMASFRESPYYTALNEHLGNIDFIIQYNPILSTRYDAAKAKAASQMVELYRADIRSGKTISDYQKLSKIAKSMIDANQNAIKANKGARSKALEKIKARENDSVEVIINAIERYINILDHDAIQELAVLLAEKL